MEQFDRLLEEQQKAIEQTDDKIRKLGAYTNEYMQLKTRLEDLSKCFSKRVIIPFSPRALVSARLIHTNEVLVYLGGNAGHFCEASTFQSLSIIDRRIGRIQQEILELQEQKRLLTDRVSYTQRLVKGEQPQSVSIEGDGGGEFEIREEFDPAREKEWQAKHKKRIQVERMRERTSIHTSPPSLPEIMAQDELPSDDTSPVSSDIAIYSSSNAALPVDPDIKDWHRASPADVVAFVQRECRGAETTNIPKPDRPYRLLTKGQSHDKSSAEVKLASQPPKYSIEPFSRIVERGRASTGDADPAAVNDGPVSRFRARRNKILKSNVTLYKVCKYVQMTAYSASHVQGLKGGKSTDE
ncbi:unconventional prefoldin rpb5 interactor [Echinococcus multilocularis]|uniref:Unconventional prefoldin rpb5 interactor n=1 Tax=Echinococcus multilocularis TaxID=6211 RepID=A0A068YCF6_ECHMU|nr:unconventional prefoldin rpb5 interactor [Echinococcus multilocularis]